jgi:hypothetical protein
MNACLPSATCGCAGCRCRRRTSRWRRRAGTGELQVVEVQRCLLVPFGRSRSLLVIGWFRVGPGEEQVLLGQQLVPPRPAHRLRRHEALRHRPRRRRARARVLHRDVQRLREDLSKRRGVRLRVTPAGRGPSAIPLLSPSGRDQAAWGESGCTRPDVHRSIQRRAAGRTRPPRRWRSDCSGGSDLV